MKPTVGEMINDSMISMAFCTLIPLLSGVSVMKALAAPTPRIAPISVWELEAGKPRYQVPRFHKIADASKEKTMMRPWADATFSNRSTGSRWTIAYATPRPPSMTPAKLKRPEATTAICAGMALV